MKTYTRSLVSGVLVITACAWLAGQALAVPYATQLKNAGGTISFILNEPADNVKIVWQGGAQTSDLGSLPKGLFSTALAVTGPFSVVVTHSAPGGWTQTSNDGDNTVKFNSPRGIAVNRRAASPYFGRVYISNSGAGTAAGRSVGDGIYILNADQTDAVGQGDTALTAGLDFTANPTYTPYRVKLGEDDSVYITDLYDGTGNLYVADPNVSAGSGKFVFPALVPNNDGVIGGLPIGSANNHGCVDTVVVVGTLAQGNLTVYSVDEDLQSDRDTTSATMLDSVWKYDIGAGPLPYTGDPPAEPFFLNAAMGPYGGQLMDLDRGPDGKFYLANRRSNGLNPGVYVLDEAGTQLWDSVTATRDVLGDPGAADILAGTVSAAVSSDGKLLATISYYDNRVTVVEMANGIPDMSRRVVFAAFGTTAAGRYVAFDAADNLHVVSSGYALYRVFSPGGSTIATTGSEGTFTVEAPLSSVSVVASVDSTSEGSATPGEFTLKREGGPTTELTVTYLIEGTATNGQDYDTLTGSVTFPDGAETVTVLVTAKTDAVPEAPETVTIKIEPKEQYTAGLPGSATVTIQDTGTPAITIATHFPTAYELTLDDYVTYRLSRLGDTNADLFVNLSYSGTAAPTDYAGPGWVMIPSGVVTYDFQVTTADNLVLDGDRTIVATVDPGPGYTVGTPASDTATILDNELPSEEGKILFKDDFETDSSADWTVLFAANNMIDDKDVFFAYDYYNYDWVPPAPNGSYQGLKLTVNKYESTAYGAAGVSLYPKGKTFSGNYALRFNMFLQSSTSGTTEHATFGINHSGSKVNWSRQTAGNVQNPAVDADGLWFAIVADASWENVLGHVLYTGDGPANPASVVANLYPPDLAGVFKAPPFWEADSGVGGAPSCSPNTATRNWVDVEVKYVDDTVTLSINRTVLFEVANSTPYGSGTFMLGYNDQWDSIGNSGAVYFDNVRVVQLESTTPPQPVITGMRTESGTVRITFTSPTGQASQFSVVSSPIVDDAYQPEGSAVVQSTGVGEFEATVPMNGAVRFYKIKR